MPAVNRLREVTGEQHRRIERRFDAVMELADPARRPSVIQRYAALYRSVHATLAVELNGLAGLEFASRARAWEAVRWPSPNSSAAPAFPEPTNRWEGLGFLYVVEGSTLGGRMILGELTKRGIADQELSFLDPYGSSSGRMWRGLLQVIEREASRGPTHLASVCRGGIRAFAHAERVLCGDA
jgi:heme oxygenase